MTRRKQRLRKQKQRTKRKPQTFNPDMETKHHRLPKSRGGSNKSENIVLVPLHLHRSYHELFANCTPTEMCHILNEWIDPAYEFVCFPRRFKR